MLDEQIAAVRVAFWAALIAVHSVFLAVGFALLVAGSKWGGTPAVVFIWSALTGLLFPIL